MERSSALRKAGRNRKQSFSGRVHRDMRTNWELYVIFIPVFLYYVLFHYMPMYGAVIAFKDFRPALGIEGSPWANPFYKHFDQFINGYYFGTLMRNTLVLSICNLVFSFPVPILLALLINELRSRRYARVIQTVTYMPHFISLVVVCSMVREFTKSDGLVTLILSWFGVPKQTMLNDPNLFVPIYVISGIWQEAGWGSIIYLSALTGIDQNLYEAAEIDGAGRFKRVLHITLPCILPTIVIMFIMRTGKIMSLGAEKVILLYNPAIYDQADIIASYVYRRGIKGTDWSYSTAVGLFNSVINFLLVISVNKLSNKLSGSGLW